MNFHVGQKVICVNDIFTITSHNIVPNRPVKGCVYTIRGFDIYPPLVGTAIWLEEIINPEVDFEEDGVEGTQEPSFWAWRFRPIRTTSIDVFTAMLAPTPVKETV